MHAGEGELRLRERPGVDHQSPAAVVQPDAGVGVLGQPHENHPITAAAHWQNVAVTYRDPAVAAAALRAAARVDLGAISSNVSRVKEIVGPAEVMAVVKAEGYGHGLVQSALAAVEGGATWLGVAFLEDCLLYTSDAADDLLC